MIEYTNTIIQHASVHFIGNKTNGDLLILSKNELEIKDKKLKNLLLEFFISPFKVPEYYGFTFTNQDINLNPLFNFATSIFDNKKELHLNSIDIAKHLFELSTHPQIKAGDLFVVYFSSLSIEGLTADAIGIFKSENKQPFLKLDHNDNEFDLDYEDGINTDKLDKGCLIFNLNKQEGYKICLVDKSNKSSEAQYWKDDFLKVLIKNNAYHQTNEFLGIAKNYITKQYADDFEVNKTDQIDLLNRSMDYFKTHDSFDKKEFEEKVFHFPAMIESFQNFDNTFRMQNAINIEDSFDINSQAVKKQLKVFKSVLKLDKNFHIYIHGNKEMIEKGIEKDGRKFYKIYYNEEN
jgi:37-kD nucleoid-associated bacterial protein